MAGPLKFESDTNLVKGSVKARQVKKENAAFSWKKIVQKGTGWWQWWAKFTSLFCFEKMTAPGTV